MWKQWMGSYGLSILLVLSLIVLQYQLWLGKGGITDIKHLNHTLVAMDKKNVQFSEQNASLQANIDDLKHGKDATEEQARAELGMVKPDESYYQIVGEPSSKE